MVDHLFEEVCLRLEDSNIMFLVGQSIPVLPVFPLRCWNLGISSTATVLMEDGSEEKHGHNLTVVEVYDHNGEFECVRKMNFVTDGEDYEFVPDNTPYIGSERFRSMVRRMIHSSRMQQLCN